MTETSQSTRVIPQPESGPARKPRFIGGLVEGIRSYGSRREISALLKEGSPEAVAGALEIYSSLDGKSRQKALGSALDSLKASSFFPFEDSSKARAIGALGEFFAGAAALAPEGGAAPDYGAAPAMLREIAEESSLYRAGDPDHRAAKLACVKALWELKAGDDALWAAMASNDAVSGYLIPKMLETSEGTAILRAEFPKVAEAVARSDSPFKSGFIAGIVEGADGESKLAAVAASVHLDKVPREIVAAARVLFRNGDPSLDSLKLLFSKAAWKSRTANRDFWRERLFDPATSDFTLNTLLADRKDGWGLLKEHMEQVAIAVATSRSEHRTEFLKAMLDDLNPQVVKVALASSIYLDSVPEEIRARAVEVSKLGSELNTYARIFFDALEFKALLAYADARQFEGAMGLIEMYRAGVNFLPPMLFLVGNEMKDIYLEPAGSGEEEREANRQKAGGVLAHLAAVGISIPGVEIKFHG